MSIEQYIYIYIYILYLWNSPTFCIVENIAQNLPLDCICHTMREGPRRGTEEKQWVQYN